MHPTFRRLAFAAASILVASQLFGGSGRVVSSARLEGNATWVSAEGDYVAFGSGRQVFVARTAPSFVVEASFEVADELLQGVLCGDRMYRISKGGDLVVADGNQSWIAAQPSPLPFRTRGSLHVARMDEHLVLAEDGYGLRFLALPPPPSHAAAHAGHSMAHGVAEVGALPFEGSIQAIAASDRRVYVATESGHLLVVDASDPSRPLLRREIAIEGLGSATALAANGSALYWLGPAGLTILSVSGNSATIEATDPEVLGGGIDLAGRAIYVAALGQGLIRFEDRNRTAALHVVTVTNNLFTPTNLTVASGDTVQWNNTQGIHNVKSCNGAGDPPQCLGNVAVDGAFTSGAAAFAPWTYSHVFTNVGLNRYYCEVHVGFNMVGTVTVQSSPPPGVPDGVGGSPLLVDKVLPNGSRLELAFDVTTCTGNANHQIVYGFGAQLPGSLGGIYNLGGSQCSIGTSPFVWNGVPDPVADAKKLLWFLVLARDGATTEGSWGKDSAGTERKGPAAGGASGQCGITVKSVSNLCGQ